MDNPLRVLIVEAEIDECNAFVKYADSISDVYIVAVTNNADKAFEHMHTFLPDAIILDLELLKGCGNGLALLESIKKTGSLMLPYILIATNNVSSKTHEQARFLGADFIMIKSHCDYSAKKAIDFLLSMKNVIQHSKNIPHDLSSGKNAFMFEEDKVFMAQKISIEFELIGINPKLVGYAYLCEAIVLVFHGKRTYITDIAKKSNKTASSVERAMQNAISNLWKNGDINALQTHYTAHISPNRGLPTLNEFVYYYANKIKPND